MVSKVIAVSSSKLQKIEILFKVYIISITSSKNEFKLSENDERLKNRRR